MRINDLSGKAVVSMTDGVRVGKVTEVVFRGLDLGTLIVLGDHGEGTLSYQNVRSNGPDAITIESSSLIDWSAGKVAATDGAEGQLMHLDVVDGEGNLLGHVHDLSLDDAGHVENISVRTDGVFGIGAHETIISRACVRAIGPKLITVETASSSASAYA